MPPDPQELPTKRYETAALERRVSYLENKDAQEDKGKTWFIRSIIITVLGILGQLLLFYFLFRLTGRTSP